MRALATPLFTGDSSWICSGCRRELSRRPFGTLPAARERRERRPTRIVKSESLSKSPRAEPRRWLSTSPSLKAAPSRHAKLPDGPARTRFAPSPTGHLHIGGLRTALFSYLLAKRTEGQFILRLEDTDQKRLVKGAEAGLYEDLNWAGLRWDEGPDVDGPYGPYKQSLRNEIYRKHGSELLEKGEAYRCFCTPQTAGEAKAAYVTSGCYQNCSSLSKEQSEEKSADAATKFTVRLRQPDDAHKRVYPDLIYGKIQRLKRSPSAPLTASEDDTGVDAADTILIKSDGTPTYHFANVVDDHLMGITHVIRGSEWMASTPLHYDIYSAFNWTPPQFAHVGLLVDQNKAKLSKRNANLALDVASMRDKHGVLPAPLINFLALLGWSNPTTNDVMELDDLIKNFDLKFTKGNAMVQMEKLWFLQKSHVAQRCQAVLDTGDSAQIQPVINQVAQQVQKTFPQPHVNALLNAQNTNPDPDAALATYCTAILLTDSKSFKNAHQFVAGRNRYFFAFEPHQVPEEREFYDKKGTITPGELRRLTERFFREGWTVELDGKEIVEERLLPHKRLEAKLHDLLVAATWRAALASHRNRHSLWRSGSGEARPSPPPFSAIQSLLSRLPASNTPTDEIAVEICKLSRPDGAAYPEVVEAKFKALNGALMRFLREKLAYGLPGPGMSAVMAILGREECKRRLEIVEEGEWALCEERER